MLWSWFAVPGIQIMLEDGSFAITDSEGRYYFSGPDHVARSERFPPRQAVPQLGAERIVIVFAADLHAWGRAGPAGRNDCRIRNPGRDERQGRSDRGQRSG